MIINRDVIDILVIFLKKSAELIIFYLFVWLMFKVSYNNNNHME